MYANCKIITGLELSCSVAHRLDQSYEYSSINIILEKKKNTLYDIISYIGGEHEKARNIKII